MIKFECKDSANRVQKQKACLFTLPRCSLSYLKIVQISFFLVMCFFCDFVGTISPIVCNMAA